MKNKIIKWVEVWIDSASTNDDYGEVCLKVLQGLEDGTIEVLDSHCSAILETCTDYEELHLLLREDEYSLMRGR